MGKATVVKSDDGKSVWLLQDKATAKLGPQHTEGRFSLSEITAQPGGGPPPHVHSREDEMFYVLEGEFEFMLNNRLFRGTPGSCVFLPKSVPHTFKCVSSKPGRFLGFASPSGFEKFAAAVGLTEPPASNEVDPAVIQKLMTLAPNFGIDLNPKLSGEPTDAGSCPDGTCYPVFGMTAKVKLGAADTGGMFAVAEVTAPPGLGPPPHTHVEQDELFYVLEGQCEFLLGDRVETHGPGTMVFVPRGVLHTFKNVGTTPLRMFDLHTPGGFENFFREAGADVPDAKTLAELMARHGMTMPG